MTLLTRKILQDLASQFLFSLLSLVAILLLGNVIRSVLKVSDLGITLPFVAELLKYMTPYSVAVAFAPACLMSGLITYGRMAAERETEIVQCSGISLARLIVPIVPVAVAASAASIWLQSEVTTWSAKERRKLFAVARLEHLPMLASHAARQLAEIVPSLRIDFATREGEDFFGVKIWRLREDGIPDTITASRARFTLERAQRKMDIILYHGFAEMGRQRPGDLSRFDKMQFEKYTLSASLPPDWRERAVSRREKYLTLSELASQVEESSAPEGTSSPADASADEAALEARKLELAASVEIHRKLAWGVCSGVFLLFGMALGISMRPKRTQTALPIVILVFTSYYVLMVGIQAAAKALGVLAPAWMWLPNVCVLLLAAGFSRSPKN